LHKKQQIALSIKVLEFRLYDYIIKHKLSFYCWHS